MTYRQFAEHAKRQARNMRRGFDSPDDDWPPSMLIELPGDGGLRPSLVGIPPRYFDSADGKDFLTVVRKSLPSAESKYLGGIPTSDGRRPPSPGSSMSIDGGQSSSGESKPRRMLRAWRLACSANWRYVMTHQTATRRWPG